MDEISKPDGVVSVAANDAPLIIPRGTRIEGLLMWPGDLRVRGVSDGELRARELIIEPGAVVAGLIVADRITVSGRMLDSYVYTRHIVLMAGCDVDAEIYYAEIDIQEGAMYEGKTRRHDKPLDIAPPVMLDRDLG